MNADMKWLDNPEIFRVNQLDAHSRPQLLYELRRYKEKGKSFTAVTKWTMGVQF